MLQKNSDTFSTSAADEAAAEQTAYLDRLDDLTQSVILYLNPILPCLFLSTVCTSTSSPTLSISSSPGWGSSPLAKDTSFSSGTMARALAPSPSLKATTVLPLMSEWHSTTARWQSGKRVHMDSGTPNSTSSPSTSCEEPFFSASTGSPGLSSHGEGYMLSVLRTMKELVFMSKRSAPPSSSETVTTTDARKSPMSSSSGSKGSSSGGGGGGGGGGDDSGENSGWGMEVSASSGDSDGASSVVASVSTSAATSASDAPEFAVPSFSGKVDASSDDLSYVPLSVSFCT